MGRPERPVDPDAGPVQRLAHELRELRRAAGRPAYRTMAQAAGFSATTLSQAAAGERLPSLAVVQGYVRACGADPGEWEARWKEAEAELHRASVADEGDAPAPYQGLARFEPGDRHLFFGRERMADALLRLVCEHRFTVLTGASGSGKSSLLRAGLIPRLREEMARRGCPGVLRILAPGPTPAATHGHLLTPDEGEPESWVVVDQFEEVFTLCRDRAERARFIGLLLAARGAESRLRVLVAVRADFAARCAEYRGLADALRQAGLSLGPMTADELRETVTGPAWAAGLRVERELTARIVEEVVDQPGALPMLSHALLETWRRRRGRTLTLAAYEAASGIRGAIAATAEQVYGTLSPDQARTARELLLRMVEPGQGAADTCRPLTRAEQDQWPDPALPLVVERLARARLLTADEDGLHLAHEALITCWPRLRGWIEENRERLRHHRRLTEAARAWAEADRDPGALHRGTWPAQAEELLADTQLTTLEREFLHAATEARAAEQRGATRSARRTRLLTGALSAVLAMGILSGPAAWHLHQDHVRHHTDDTARRLAAAAEALRTTDPRTAMLLGVAAWRISPLPESRRALLGALAQPELDAFTDPVPGSDRFLADSGRTLLSADGGTWQSWDVTARRRTASGGLPDRGRVVAVSPDARVLAVAVAGKGVRLWNTVTGQWTGPASPRTASVTFGGTAYLMRATDGSVRVRSVRDDRLLFETQGPGDVSPALSPDGHLLAVCPAGRVPRLWDMGSGRTVPGAWERSRGMCDDGQTAWVPGSGRLAALTSTGVHVWDARSGRRVADLDDPGAVWAAFSGDGRFLATAGRTEIRVWRLTAPAAPVLRHSLHNRHLDGGGLAWDPARPVLRYLEGGTVHSLDLARAVTSEWRDRPLDGTLLSPDGRTLATADGAGFRLHDPRDGRVLRTLPPPPPPFPKHTVPLMAFSPDGRSFAYGVQAPGRRLTIWDLSDDRVRSTVALADAAAGALALGPDGRTMLPAPVGTPLAVRPDGRLLVEDGRVVHLPSGRARRLDLVQGERIGALAFAADGSRLVAGDATGRVALWDGGLRRRTGGILPGVFPTPLGDTPESVSALALSPDGRTLAVGGDAGSLHLWDIAARQPLGGRLPTPGDTITTLAFSPDGRTLYAGGPHVPLQRYDVDAERAVTLVCGRVQGELTREQWETHVGEVPYRKVCG